MNRLLDVKNPYDLKSWIRFWTLQKYVISAFVVIKFNRNIMYSRHPITWTLGNSNSPLTRSNFCFPSDHFYNISPSITRTMFKARDKLIKKIVVYSSPKQWIFFKYQPCILCLYFLSVQCKYCPALYINQVLLFKMLNYFFKNHVSCCPWSEGCMVLALNFFPIHKVSCRACHHHKLMWLFENRIFLIPGFLLRNPDNLNFR